MIDGIWWLVIFVAVIVGLWLLGHRRGASEGSEDKTTTGTRSKLLPNDALQKTATLLKKDFKEYHVTRNGNHLLLIKQDKKIAMITIDEKLAAGQRFLGGVPILNYHRTPSRVQLSDNLLEVETIC